MMRQSERDRARAWVEIDLGALRRNGAAIARRAGVPLLPMIKADAYGLGAEPVARALEPLAPWGYGVATVDEGCTLRSAGVTRPIVVFTPLLETEFLRAREADLTLVLGDRARIAAWSALGGRWHLGIDTGMARAGIRWDLVRELDDVLRAAPPEGACTHFHSAGRDPEAVTTQERRFADALDALPSRPSILHAENGVVLEWRAPSHWSVVRPGIFLYGVGQSERAEIHPEPVVHLRARVVDLRDLRDGDTVSYDATYRAVGDRRVATLAAGYADGYRRSLSNRGVALVRGRRVPVAGLVTMDMTMLDVTGVPCEVGDVATLIGRDGDEVLSVADVARIAEVSPYELLTGLRGRPDRLYHEAAS